MRVKVEGVSLDDAKDDQPGEFRISTGNWGKIGTKFCSFSAVEKVVPGLGLTPNFGRSDWGVSTGVTSTGHSGCKIAVEQGGASC
jgi:hypothetical protein